MPKLVDLIEAITQIRLDQKILERAAVVNSQMTHGRLGRLVHEFTLAVVDSRQAVPGALFIAIPGEKVDGHSFVSDAFERGAVMALVEKDVIGEWSLLDTREPVSQEDVDNLPVELPVCIRVTNSLEALQQIARFWRGRLNLRVIGVTGSVGKSTSKELVAQVLAQKYTTFRNPGNLNNEIGLPLSILSLTDKHECAVLEMGFYVPGEITFLCEIARPQIGIITNVGTVHAERAGSRDVIASGKSELVQSLPEGGVAILNYDDIFVREMATKTKARVFFYGMDPKADLWADEVDSMGLDGIHFRLHYHKETVYLHIPMIGRHSVQTALRATAAGLVTGLSWQEIVQGLRAASSQLRLVTTRARSGALVLDDTYNASPESTLAALNLLSELAGNKVAVLGDMLELGPYERRGHALVGLRAAEVVDELVTVGERGRQIALAARMGGLPQEKINHFEDTELATTFLKEHLTRDDVVLVKGSRGMRMDRMVTALEEQS